MRHRQYPLTTGQIVVSPVDLSYAYDSNLTVDLNEVTASDFRRISILANETMADIVTELSDGRKWRTPTFAMSQSSDPGYSSTKNYCLIHNGDLFIKDGKKHIRLDKILETASREELVYIMRNLAYQTAICQAALAGLDTQADEAEAV